MNIKGQDTDSITFKRDKRSEFQCEFYLIKKKRLCSMTKSKNNRYCSEHLNNSYEDYDSHRSRKRIPCTLDPKHSVWADQLQKHLKKCNKSKLEIKKLESNCFKNNFNILYNDSEIEEVVSDEMIIKSLPILKRINEGEFTEELETQILFNKIFEEFRFCQLQTNKKHAIQHSSLIGTMKKCNLWPINDSKNCFIEFGCGRGEFSRAVNQTILLESENTYKSVDYILIDRSSNRMKYDKKMRDDFNQLSKDDNIMSQSIIREKIDIKDLNLDPILTLDTYYFSISKHLCGVATDLTLRCLLNSEILKNNYKGGVIAMCCRHICNYTQYCNQSYIESLLLKYGSTLSYRNFFSVLSKTSSWATCSRKLGSNESNHFTNLSYDEREKIGFISRRIIDHGRLKFMEQNGFKGKLIKYVDLTVSLENIAMVIER